MCGARDERTTARLRPCRESCGEANDLGRPASAVSFAFQLLVVTTSAGGAIAESCVGRLDGGGLHRVCVLRQDEPVGDTTVERSVPPAEIRLPLGVELMQLRSGKRTATRGVTRGCCRDVHQSVPQSREAGCRRARCRNARAQLWVGRRTRTRCELGAVALGPPRAIC